MEGLLQKVVIALLSVVLTGAGAWLTWGREVRSESKVIDLIETHSPYIEDRKLFERSLVQLDELTEAVGELTITMKGFSIVLQHQLDQDHHDDEENR